MLPMPNPINAPLGKIDTNLTSGCCFIRSHKQYNTLIAVHEVLLIHNYVCRRDIFHSAFGGSEMAQSKWRHQANAGINNIFSYVHEQVILI